MYSTTPRPATSYQPRYLSGNVRHKLEAAETAATTANGDGRWQANIDALHRALPTQPKPGDITVRLGAPWVHPDDIELFCLGVLDAWVNVEHLPGMGRWTVKRERGNGRTVALTSQWGAQRADAITLLDASLNQRLHTVYDTVDKKRIRNDAETLAAREKQEVLGHRFSEWIWENPTSGQRVADSYNRLLTEARTAGLLDTEPDPGTAAGLEALRAITTAPLTEMALDDEQAAQRERLRRRREDLRQQLYQIGQERAALETFETDESDYEDVVAQQAARLRSLELLGPDTNMPAGDCPVCGSALPEPDPTVEELRTAAAELQAYAGSFAITRPRRRQALQQVEARATAARGEMRAIEQAINGIETARQQITSDRRFAERQAFLQGRISHYLDTLQTTDHAGLTRLQERVRLRQAVVEELESQLDQDEEREQLLSRLVAIGGDMTLWADRLALEHSGTSVRLDPRRLTVVADTPSGPAPLNQIGSAANWIGYHLVAHLALHKFLVEQDRPVPRFLMLDQPTQAYYPSDVTRESGLPGSDADRAAVQSMFELFTEVATLLDNRLQIIVCDHANLPDDWFQEAVIEDRRDGRRLIPATGSPEPETEVVEETPWWLVE